MTDNSTCCKNNAAEHSDGSLTITKVPSSQGAARAESLTIMSALRRVEQLLDEAANEARKVVSVDSAGNLRAGFLISVAEKWLGVAAQLNTPLFR